MHRSVALSSRRFLNPSCVTPRAPAPLDPPPHACQHECMSDEALAGARTPDPELPGDRLTLVPVVPGHLEELRRILHTPEVWARWGDDDDDNPDWPFDEDDPDSRPFAIVVDGMVRGLIQYGEENTPRYRHASIDIFLDPLVHGQGLGREAVRTLALYLVRERGHHRLVIDPAADNEQAIRSYAAVGFRPVGLMRRYERDPGSERWHDGLLMDLLAEELDV
jgi:RimJ/RimL family protein N-acetyltransferase